MVRFAQPSGDPSRFSSPSSRWRSTAAFAVSRMRIDIFPDLNLPVIYVAQPYGGMDPAQMEGYLVYYYEYHFLYINGIESVEVEVDSEHRPAEADVPSGHGHGRGDGADHRLRQPRAGVHAAGHRRPVRHAVRRRHACRSVTWCSRAQTRSLGEIQDLALNRVRPQFATLDGLTSPPPFGGSQRTIVIRVDPDRLRAYGMSPDEVIKAVSAGNVIMPSGSVNIGDEIAHLAASTPSCEHQRSARAADPHRRRADGVRARHRIGRATAPTSRPRTRS